MYTTGHSPSDEYMIAQTILHVNPHVFRVRFSEQERSGTRTMTGKRRTVRRPVPKTDRTQFRVQGVLFQES